MYNMRPTIMTVSELAKYLRLHEQTVYKMAKEGRVPAYKVGNRWRFRRETIDAWLKDQRDAAGDSVAEIAPEGSAIIRSGS